MYKLLTTQDAVREISATPYDMPAIYSYEAAEYIAAQLDGELDMPSIVARFVELDSIEQAESIYGDVNYIEIKLHGISGLTTILVDLI